MVEGANGSARRGCVRLAKGMWNNQRALTLTFSDYSGSRRSLPPPNRRVLVDLPRALLEILLFSRRRSRTATIVSPCARARMAPIFDLSPVYDILDALLSNPLPSSKDFLLPVLLETAASRPSRCHSRSSTILKLEQTLEAIGVAEQKLEALRTQVNACRGRLTYSMSLFSAFPDEVLRRVFELSVRHEEEELAWGVAGQNSISLSHVSSVWRAVALATPRLWTCLTVGSKRQTYLLDLFVARLGGLKLHLGLNSLFRNLKGDPHPVFLLDPAPESIQSLASFHLRDDTISSGESCFSWPQCDETPPAFEELSFAHCNVQLMDDEFFRGAQTLQLYNSKLDCVNDENGNPFTFAHMERVLCACMVPDQIIRFLEQSNMPQLRVLSLEHCGALQDDAVRASVADCVFPRLESLILDRCSESIWIHLAKAVFPELRKLSLRVEHWNHQKAFERIFYFVCDPFTTAQHGVDIDYGSSS